MNCSEAEGFRLGRYYPTLEIDRSVMTAWTSRDVLHLGPCSECPLALLCGGGCARLVARRSGDLTNDIVCPPIVNRKDLQVLLDYYLPLILESQREQSK
jgi:radical SAM protein with 4Fe4S-binding SPASM domain